ncbi:MAG: ABC transporter substrate-binding protein [Solirubrobacteraceae bacterium]
MRKYLCVCAVVALAVAVAGCGGSKSQAGSTASKGAAGSSKQYAELRWGMTPFPGELDFNRVGYGPTGAVEALAVQNLMEFEPSGKVKPGLASSVEQPSPTTYVYHLKSVKFSDGTPMTSADVVYSLDRDVYGKESWAKSFWEDVASIGARNSSTVVVKLKRPDAEFQGVVAFSGLIIEKAAAEKVGEKALGTPGNPVIGTGPWKIENYTTESSVHFSANPYWTGQARPASKIGIEFFKTEASMALALRSGAIDGADTYVSPKVFANIPDVQQMTGPGEDVILAQANPKFPPFNDVHVRRAMAYATDGKGMVQALYGSAFATEDSVFVPNSMFATLGSPSEVENALASVPKLEFNLAKAKQELEKSAYPHGFSMPIEVPQGLSTQVSAAQILASDLAKIGIKATVHEVTHSEEPGLYTDRAKLAILGSTASYADPESIIEERLAPTQIYPQGGGVNIAKYHNATFDKLLAQVSETLNPQQRLQVMGKMLTVLAEEVPDWPMYSPGNFGALSSKYVFPGFSFWTAYYCPWALNVKLAA